jgi:SAM-dependent methyltransferase
MKCRHCATELELQFIDLQTSPPSNSYLSAAQLPAPERWYPLRVRACTRCWLVQTEDYAHHSELFSSDYAYFSSYSDTWLAHARAYVGHVAERFNLGPASLVVEVASNDGYLLQYVQERGIPCLGIEPTLSTAQAARARGIRVVSEFFGRGPATRLVREGQSADVMAANNVLAHVPDINDFVGGFATLLKIDGVATFEFPHLQRLVQECQFDTIYHEHFSYLSLSAVVTIFRANGLGVFDVQELPTHGGSLRVFAQRLDTGKRDVTAAVPEVLQREAAAGMTSAAYYAGFQARADRVKNDFLSFLIQAKRDGRKVGAYGAAAKGNTLLNYAGVRSDLLPWVVDRNPAKQGKYLPGSRIAIVSEAHLRAERPDLIVILPWNLSAEVTAQLAYARDWGAKFVQAVPELTIR